jgi:DNA-binding NarL/FixJ family response regulator
MRRITKIKHKALPVHVLTQREQQVFGLIVEKGFLNQEVARTLKISERSAKFHTSNVLRKIGAADRMKLVIAYWSNRIAGEQRTSKTPAATRKGGPRRA